MNPIQFFPALTGVFAFLLGVLNLYLVNKLNNSEKKILAEVRNEIEKRFEKTATKEQMGFMEEKLLLKLEGIKESMVLTKMFTKFISEGHDNT